MSDRVPPDRRGPADLVDPLPTANVPAAGAPSESSVTRWLLLWVLPLIMLAGLGLRWQFAQQPLWIDELHTAWVVQSDWSEVAWRAAIGNQSPLFFYLVKMVIEVLGFSPLNLRLISIVASTLQIGVVFGVLLRWTGAPAAGTVAACLMMVNPIQLFAGTDARPYALIGLVACGQIALLVEYWQRATGQRGGTYRFDVAWVGTTTLLFYLHYTTLLWSAALWIGWCWLSVTSHPRPSRRQVLRWLLGMPVLMVILALPGLWHLATILPFGGQWSSFVRLDSFFISLSSLLLVLLIGPLLAGLIVQFLYLLKPGQMWSLVRGTAWWPLMVMTLCGLFLPPVTAALLTGWSIMPVAHWRYFAASVSVGFFLPGLMIGIWYWPRVRWMITALMIALGLASNWDLLGVMWTGKWPRLHDEQWADVSQMIRQVTAERDLPVILCPGLVEDGWLVREHLPLTPEQRARFRHYCIFALDGPYRIYDDPERNREWVSARPTDDRLRMSLPQAEQIRQNGGCFLVVRSHQTVLAKNIAKHIKMVMSTDKQRMQITELAPAPVSLFLIEATDVTEDPNPGPPVEDPRILRPEQDQGFEGRSDSAADD